MTDDVLVVGAGPAGALAALILARAGLRVRVFERARFPRSKLCGDTVNPGGWRVLARHLPAASVCAHAKRIDGMMLTGPGKTMIHSRYGAGECGYALERRTLDMWLLQQAIRAGVQVEEGCAVDDLAISDGGVAGVYVRSNGVDAVHRARLVIAADGRHSRLSFALGLATHPRRPRRWAIGAYFEGVQELAEVGEMHVRCGHYIGVAPMPHGVANACLVLPHAPGQPPWRDVSALLRDRLAGDDLLAPRFAGARMLGAPVVLGPMAVEVTNRQVPGLLSAGDAAGFVDPMTGDGMTLAWRGAETAAHVAIDVLSGRVPVALSACELARRRQRQLRSKLRFNRTLRRLVSSGHGVSGAAVLARYWPAAFEAIVRYAGDVKRN